MILTEAKTKSLIAQTAQGDQQAFEELCRAHERRLFGVVLKIVGTPDVAKEVMQEVMLAIWKGSKYFKGDSKPFTWMFAIARHKAFNTLRGRLRQAAFTEEGPDESFREKPELDAVIGEGLRKLSVDHRLVVILTYYLNLSQSRISEIMHCPVGTVKSRLSYALRQLRNVWDTPFKAHSFSVLRDDLRTSG